MMGIVLNWDSYLIILDSFGRCIVGITLLLLFSYIVACVWVKGHIFIPSHYKHTFSSISHFFGLFSHVYTLSRKCRVWPTVSLREHSGAQWMRLVRALQRARSSVNLRHSDAAAQAQWRKADCDCWGVSAMFVNCALSAASHGVNPHAKNVKNIQWWNKYKHRSNSCTTVNVSDNSCTQRATV